MAFSLFGVCAVEFFDRLSAIGRAASSRVGLALGLRLPRAALDEPWCQPCASFSRESPQLLLEGFQRVLVAPIAACPGWAFAANPFGAFGVILFVSQVFCCAGDLGFEFANLRAQGLTNLSIPSISLRALKGLLPVSERKRACLIQPVCASLASCWHGYRRQSLAAASSPFFGWQGFFRCSELGGPVG